MIKLLIIFFVGLLEQILYTGYLLAVDRRKLYLSSILMFVYMTLYLFIVAYAMKDSETILILLSYATACGIGNYIVIRADIKNRKKINQKNLYIRFIKWINTNAKKTK